MMSILSLDEYHVQQFLETNSQVKKFSSNPFPFSKNPFPPPPPPPLPLPLSPLPLSPAIIQPSSSKNGFVFLVDSVNLEAILSGVVACICLQFVMRWMDAIWKDTIFYTIFEPWYSTWFCEKMQFGPCFCSQLGIGWKKKTIHMCFRRIRTDLRIEYYWMHVIVELCVDVHANDLLFIRLLSSKKMDVAPELHF